MNLQTADARSRRIVLLAALALFVGLGWSTIYRGVFSPNHRTDFTVYTAAGQAILDGTNIYDAHNVRGWYYMYLPIFAIVMVPFAKAGALPACVIWYLLSAAALVHGVELSIRLIRRAFPNLRIDDLWIRTFAVLLLLPPVLSGVARGQASVLIMYLMILGVWFYFEKRPWASGLALACSIVLKIFPALIVLYFLIQRRFRFVFATAAWLLLLVLIIPSVVFGPTANLKLLKNWNETVAVPANKGVQEAGSQARYEQMINPRNRRNQSARAVIVRSASGLAVDVEDENEEYARPIALLTNVFLFLMTSWVCFQNAAGDSTRRSLMKICTVILLMLMISPVTWNHNFALLLLPLAVAIGSWRSPAEPQATLFGWSLAVYGAGTFLSLIDWFSYFGAPFWGTLLLWIAFVKALLGDAKLPRESARDFAATA